MIAHINIGTNKGDRIANLSRAVSLISKLSESAPRVSCIIETESWGYDSPNKYLNQAIEISFSQTPEMLLEKLHEIEISIDNSPHRDCDGGYIDRVIDVDLIFIDNQIINREVLTIPHPRLDSRYFVLKLIDELSPCWVHPIKNKTAKQLLNELR